MSYNSFLDTYFSSKWFGYGVPALILILSVVFSKRLPLSKKSPFLVYILNMILPFVLAMIYALVNPTFWGYGHPVAIDEIRFEKDKLYVLDYTLSAGGRYSDPISCERIHILDPETGTKKIRFHVGDDGQFVGVHGDSVAVARYDNVAYFSNSDGHLFVVYSRETLPGLFKELSSGVNDFMWGDGRNIMEISADDGTHWNLYAQTGTIYSTDKKEKNEKETAYVPTNKISIHDREIRIDNQPGEGVLLKLDGENENQNKLFVMNEHDSILNGDMFFLDGNPVALDLKDSCFFILHYETLKHEKFLISCVSLDGKRKLWEIRQSDFNPDFKYREPFLPKVGADEKGGKLFFSIDKEVFAVKMKDGKLMWRTEL